MVTRRGMLITSGNISVLCHTEQDVKDVCSVLGTKPWSDEEVTLFEKLILAGVSSADAMRRVDEAREQQAS